MKLDQLQYFIAVAETQHIGKASRMLHISPSAISHSVRKLEEDLGQKLFEKTGKNIYLTDYGKQVAQRSRELLDHAARLRQELRAPTAALQGILRVGAVHGIADGFVAPALGALQKKHPGLIFELYSLRSAQVLEQIAGGQLDLGVCFAPLEHPSVTRLGHVDTRLEIAARPGHPLLKKGAKKISPSELASYPTAAPKAFAGIEVCENHPALAKAGIEPKPSLIVDSYETSGAYLLASDAWALIPGVLLDKLGIKALPIAGFEARTHVALISPKGRAIPAPVRDAVLKALDT